MDPRQVEMFPEAVTCAHCLSMVNIEPMLRDQSEVAQWGILQTIRQWGTLCDDCYARQEALR